MLLQATHEAYLARSIGPIRRYGAADPDVMSTLLRTIVQIRSEVVRRELPGPLGPLDAAASATIATADTSTWSAYERDQFRSIVDVSERS
jgi:uncharacterized membrane protein